MSRWRDVVRGGIGKGTFPHELWFLLEIPGRRLIHSPERLVERLHLSANSRVLEIGPGSGFFSLAVAKRIPAGHLTLLDLQPEFLARVQRKLKRLGLQNFTCTHGDASNLPFAGDRFDVVFLVAVLGEISDRVGCLREAFRALKPSGILSITEQHPDPDFVSREDLDATVASERFEFMEAWDSLVGYTVNYRKPVEA